MIGNSNAANIFATTTSPTTSPTNNTSYFTITNVSSNSGFSVEFLDDFTSAEPGNIIRFSPSAWVQNNRAYFTTTTYKDDVLITGDITYQEEVNAVTGQEVWSYDGDEFRLYCKKSEFLDLGEKIFLLDEKVFWVHYSTYGGQLLGCSNTTVWVVHPDPTFSGSRVTNLVKFKDMLYFVGYDSYEAFDRKTKSLFISDGTVEGTTKLLEKDVLSIETTAPGSRYVGDIEPLIEGMPKLAFHVENEGVWVTDGTFEGTKPFLLDTQEISQISDSFNGGKFLFRAGENTTMVTNWEDETIPLLDGFKLDDSLKLNDTHMVFVGGGDPTLWITDGTVDGTQPFFSAAEKGEFRLFRRLGDDMIQFNFRVPDSRIGVGYITDGTTEGTTKVEAGEYPSIAAQAWTFLPDYRTLIIPDETYNNSHLLMTLDYLNKQVHYIEDVDMPAMGANLSRYFMPIRNNSILFFAYSEETGWHPWKILYPNLGVDSPPEYYPSGNISATNMTPEAEYQTLMPPTENISTVVAIEVEITEPPAASGAVMYRLFWVGAFYLALCGVQSY